MGITEWTILVILHFILLVILWEGLSLLVVKNLLAMQETQVQSLGLEDPHWRREWLPTPVFLPRNSMDRGAWWATVHEVAKSRTQLNDFPLHFSSCRELVRINRSPRQ